MKLQIKEFARLTGVSVRTLHYYHEIGLLPPAAVEPQTGYRFYDDNSLLRMQEILFYRELDFPLKRICEILSAPHYNKDAVLAEQKKLLTLKKERLERLIAAIDGAGKGENVMKAFDNSQFEAYQAEVQQRWGQTEAYAEYAEKRRAYGKDSYGAMMAGLEDVLAEAARCKASGAAPESAEAQAVVGKLQQYITDNFYTCTKPILAGLGQMYVADERFRENIDRHGEGTAAFLSAAIAAYCK